MSEFKYHTSCPKCGSSDARAVYLGGSSWCFSCHAYSRGNIFSERLSNEDKPKETKALPPDLSTKYGPEALEWIFSYQIKIEELLRHGVLYSEYRKQLYYIWRDDEGSVVAWQARNFNGKGLKYISSGELDSLLPIYLSERTVVYDKLVLVEDCNSAIKIARQNDAMPCLTSSLSTSKLKRLAGLYRAFTVWLDGNMFDNAQKMARQLQLMGREARAVYTPLDPKCYEDTTITSVLLTGKLP